ncbi:MAG: haloalkane dehalogenase [Candidatus Caldarchaeum sp.]
MFNLLEFFYRIFGIYRYPKLDSELSSPDYPFESRHLKVNGSEMHYIEKGEGRVFLFLHGNATWSYLWRNVIPRVAEHGRCIAFDLVGFGRSDKPAISYKFLEHYKYVEGFIDELGLKDLVLIGHDWGAVLGLYYALNHRENVAGVILMESFPFTYSYDYYPKRYRIYFKLWRTPFIGHLLIMVRNEIIKRGIPLSTYKGISKEVHRHYMEPFPTIKSRYPIYALYQELPIEGRETDAFREIKRLEQAYAEFTFPMLFLTCTPGEVRQWKIEWFQRTVKDLTVKNVGESYHYPQEDNPKGVADAIVEWARNKGLFFK